MLGKVITERLPCAVLFSAHVARIPHAVVRVRVLVQRRAVHERLLAQVARVIPDVEVNVHVLCEIGRLRKCLVAEVARDTLMSVVQVTLDVIVQRYFVDKASATIITMEVLTFMQFQVRNDLTPAQEDHVALMTSVYPVLAHFIIDDSLESVVLLNMDVESLDGSTLVVRPG